MIFDVIFGFVIGVLFGNFASTALYRLPGNIPLSGYNTQIGKIPHCSACGHKLKFYEYLPVLSWIFTQGQCNYCSAKINIEYFILEILTALLGIGLYFITHGFNENYLLLLFSGAAFILFSLIKNKSLYHANYILLLIAFIGALYRTLNEVSIYGWITSFLISYFIFTTITMKLISKDIITKYNMHFLLISGIWLQLPYLVYYILLFSILMVLKRTFLFKINHIHMAILLYSFIVFT